MPPGPVLPGEGPASCSSTTSGHSVAAHHIDTCTLLQGFSQERVVLDLGCRRRVLLVTPHSPDTHQAKVRPCCAAEGQLTLVSQQQQRTLCLCN